VDAEIRLYDTLFAQAKPDDADDFKTALNPSSLEVLRGAKVELALASVAPETRVQFERQGYFVADWKDHTPARPVFNRTVGLRDTWAKVERNLAQT
jgi:glutaminyl-tRNA synthetase